MSNLFPAARHAKRAEFFLVGTCPDGTAQQKFVNVSFEDAVKHWDRMGIYPVAMFADKYDADVFQSILTSRVGIQWADADDMIVVEEPTRIVDDLDEMEYPGKFRSGAVMI